MKQICFIHTIVVFQVASLRNRFESLTKEAAELKIKLDRENETIEAAETLVSKLEGEYQRWNQQV